MKIRKKHLIKQPPRVLLLLQTVEKSQRDFLHGIIRFVRYHGPWEFHIVQGRVGEQNYSENLSDYDGMIAYAINEKFLETIRRFKGPCIVVDAWDDFQRILSPDRYNRVLCDSASIGRKGAEIFLQQCHQRFAYVADSKHLQWSRERFEGYRTRLMEAGFEPYLYVNTNKAERDIWELDKICLTKFLKELPKPIAVLAAMDIRGRQIIELCRAANIDVPNEVAVLGIDNDEMICESSWPPLSSIEQKTEAAGFQGAALLDQLIANPEQHRSPVQISYGAGKFISRKSTDSKIAFDSLVAKGIEFIRLNYDISLKVSDIADYLDVSRRNIEIRFRKILGHSIVEEIMEYRLEKVCELLTETTEPITDIASLTGFKSVNYLSFVFKKKFGETMRDYRMSSQNDIPLTFG